MYKKKTGRSPLLIKGCDLFIAFFCLVAGQMDGRVSDCRNFNGTIPLPLGISPFSWGIYLSIQFKAVTPHFLQNQIYNTTVQLFALYYNTIIHEYRIPHF